MLPTIYLPHGGGPCFFMEVPWGPPDMWLRMADWLRGINASLPEQPKALLVISGHWEASVPTVTSNAAPPLIYDYYGFPPHTYELTWPAPGAPALAERVRGLLGAAGMAAAADPERGFDHGVFIPLKLSYPQADVPTVQLSLLAGLDPAAHLAMGRALAPLRDEGVLILGSGMSYHNMRGYRTPQALADSQRFDDWLSETVQLEREVRETRLRHWEQAPAGRASHPREEHLLPLMVAAGAAGDGPGEQAFKDNVLGAVISAFRFN
jgi:aromatic ring-opening dioxygenase catalytic subunit (LigB family)